MKSATKNKILGYVIYIFAFLLVVSYLLYHLFFYSSENDIVTEFAHPVTERIFLSADAYVMRNEKIINPSGNSVSAAFYFNDGEKVSKNSTIAAVYTNQDESHGDALVEIDKRIDFLEKSSFDNTFMTSDTGSIDRKLDSIYYSIRLSIAENSMSSALTYSDEMLSLLNRRMIITGESSGFDDQIEQLRKQRERYSSSYGNISTSLTTDVSGYFYSSCDGYENIFASDKALSMSYDEFENMILESPDEDIVNSLCKIAYDYRWYLSCPVKKNDLKNFEIGKSYTIIFETNANKELNLTLAKILTDSDGDGAVLVFESFDCPSDFTFTRLQSVKIVQDTISGIKVPVGALRIVDGKEGVYILYGSKVYFCEIDIIGRNENYYIASHPDLSVTPYGVLCVYDNIIVSGKDLYEGKVIN